MEYENFKYIRHNVGDRIMTTCYIIDADGKWIELYELDDNGVKHINDS